MKLIKLGQLFKITAGGTPSKKNLEFYENGNIPWIKTGDLKAKELYNASEYITELGLEKSSAKLFPKNTVLIAMYGATIGATSILKIEATTNQACCAFLPCSKVLPEYLYYFFKANKENIIAMGVGGAQPNISATILKEIKIPMIDLEKQDKIVKVLDKAQQLIDKRKVQIEALNELVKSQFIEMFGHPSNNEKGWNTKTFGDISTVRQGLQIPISKRKTEPAEKCLKYITIQFLNGGKSAEYIENPKQNVICNTEDVLMTRTGNTGMVVSNVSGVFHNNFFLIDFDRSLLNKVFLVNYLNDNYIQADIIRRAGTSTIPDLNHGEFYKVKILLPPMELQIKFEEFVKQIDKLKFEMQKSLEEMENNFNSLMQRAFKGELFNEF